MPLLSFKSDVKNNNKLNKKRLQASKTKHVKAPKVSIQPFIMMFMVVGIALSVGFGINHLFKTVKFPIENIVFSGNINQLDKLNLIQKLKPQTEQGFFSLSLVQVAHITETQHWVAQATARRIWPNTVEILIREHQAVAIWDSNTLVSANGVLFNVPSISQTQLPKIHGLDINAKQILTAFSHLEQIVDPFEMSITGFNQSQQGELNVELDNQLKLTFSLTNADQQFERFAALLEKGFMQKQTIKISSIDMRYSNGFAVEWIKNAEKAHVKQLMNKIINGKRHV